MSFSFLKIFARLVNSSELFLCDYILGVYRPLCLVLVRNVEDVGI